MATLLGGAPLSPSPRLLVSSGGALGVLYPENKAVGRELKNVVEVANSFTKCVRVLIPRTSIVYPTYYRPTGYTVHNAM